MSEPRQIPLDLGHRPAMGRADFLVGPANSDAVAWIDRWPEWPNRALAIFGPAGCGKSHLARVFATRADAAIVPAADIDLRRAEVLANEKRALVIEDGDSLAHPRAILHVLNALRESARGLLITGREPPARWAVALPDLASRLKALTAVGIQPPDDEMFAAILVKLFADRQIAIGPEVVTYLVRRIDRSFDAARRIVAAADESAMAEGRAITVPLVKRLTDSI